MSAPRPPLAVYLKLVLTTAFWGGAFIAGRHLAQHMPHFVAATGRFAVALVPLLALAAARGDLPRLAPRQRVATALLGATGVFAYNAFFFAGLALVPASRGALIVALSPIITMLVMRLLGRERWRPSRAAGVALSLAGVTLVVARGDPAAVWRGEVGRGELWMLFAVVAWVAYTILGRQALAGLSALAATAWSTLWGTAMLALPAAFELAHGATAWPDAGSWLAIAYLGVFGTALGFVWYNEAVAALGPGLATLFTNLVPVFAVIFSVLFLGERPAGPTLAGGAMVVAGVLLANRQGAVAVTGLRR